MAVLAPARSLTRAMSVAPSSLADPVIGTGLGLEVPVESCRYRRWLDEPVVLNRVFPATAFSALATCSPVL